MNQRKNSLIEKDIEFRRYYTRFLQPLEQRFESLRQKAVVERNRRMVAALLAWFAALGGVVYLGPPIGDLWWFVGIFGLGCAFGLGIWAWLPAGAHEIRLQEQVLPRIVPFFGDLRYRPEPDLVPARYSDWKVLPSFSKTSSEDQIEGSYRGVPLKLAELRLQYESRSNNSSSTETAFRGLMIDFELGQEYPGVTLIRSRGSNMKGRFHLDENLGEVGGDPDFEVFASRDAPGSKIANSIFLKRLAKVSAQFEARQLFASFHAKRLVMLIEHKGDYFEMSHRQKTDFAKDAERIRDQLGRIFSIVDLLELHRESGERPVNPGVLNDPVFPDLPKPKTADGYDTGGWGCLGAFLVFVASVLAYLRCLESDLSPEARLGWSTLGGLLATLGLFQTFRGIFRMSIWALLFGIIFLAGALLVLYYYGPSDIQALIGPWVPENLSR
ncbi:MAG: DUF3137 domain-containing protein [Gammaproteobacteria bacterium]